MYSVILVRTVQAENGDGNIERLSTFGPNHVELTGHEAGGRLQWRSRRVLEAPARCQYRLLAHHALTLDTHGVTRRVGDVPGSAKELDGLPAAVTDLDAVCPDEMPGFGFRLLVQIIRADMNAYASGCRMKPLIQCWAAFVMRGYFDACF